MTLRYRMHLEAVGTADIEPLCAHFDGLEHRLESGKVVRYRAEPPRFSYGIPAASIESNDLLPGFLLSLQHAVDVSEAGLRLYHHLLNAPPFRYARFGSTAGPLESTDLHRLLSTASADGGRSVLNCMVMDDPLWQAAGQPRGVKPFRPGYWWSPYSGEWYCPMGSTDYPHLVELAASIWGCY